MLQTFAHLHKELRVLHPALRPYSRYLVEALKKIGSGYTRAEQTDEINFSKVQDLLFEVQQDFWCITGRLQSTHDFELCSL